MPCTVWSHMSKSPFANPRVHPTSKWAFLGTVSPSSANQPLPSSFALHATTLTLHMNSRAFCLVICRMSDASLRGLQLCSALETRFGVGIKQAFILKYTYDEMSMRLRVRNGHGSGGTSSFASVVAKLLQVQLTWACLLHVPGPNLWNRLKLQLPTVVYCIYSCKAPTSRAG